MTALFQDGFDMYGAISDAGLGRWSGGNSLAQTSYNVLIAGAFGTGQALEFGNYAAYCQLTGIFVTGTNEATVYFSLRLKNINATASGQGLALTFLDGSNAQCCIYWRGDGAIQVFSGAQNGTSLTTLTGAYSSATWNSYQGKVVINNTTGAVQINKDGSATPIINLTSVNTRAGSTNNYCNQFSVARELSNYSAANMAFDDLMLCNGSGSAPNAFLPDVRCVTQMPASQSGSNVFTASPATVAQTIYAGTSNVSRTAGIASYVAFTPTVSGTIASGTLGVIAGGTGNLKVALFDAALASVLATSSAIVNPAAGTNTYTFATPPTVTKGTSYYLALDQDFSIQLDGASGTSVSLTSTTAYASFPATSPTTTSGQANIACSINITGSVNADYVAEATEDGDSTYVQSSTATNEDKYGIAALSVTPASIVGVAPFAFWRRSDAGSRTATLSVTANGSADTGEVVGVIPSTSYLYNQTFMPTDPTGAAWTTANVNGMLLGVSVAS